MITRRAFETQTLEGATRSQAAHRDVSWIQDVDNGRRARSGIALARDEYDEHLPEIQQEMEGSDEETYVGDDQHGTLFDKTTKLYEDHKLTDGSIAD